MSPVAWLAGIGEKLDPDLRYHVLGSGLSTSLERYTLAYLIVMAIAVPSVAAAVFTLLEYRGLPATVAAAAAAGSGLATFTIMLASYISLPMLAYANRGSKLEPRFLLFAESLSTKLLAGADLATAFIMTYEKEAEELRDFLLEVEYIASGLRAGMPPEGVLEEAARLTPSPSLKRLFTSLAAAARTGTGVREIVLAAIREHLYSLETEIERLSRSLGAILEVYVAASAMLPVAVGVVGLLLAIGFQGAAAIPGLNINSILFLLTFVAVPVVSATVVVLVDSMLSRVRI